MYRTNHNSHVISQTEGREDGERRLAAEEVEEG